MAIGKEIKVVLTLDDQGFKVGLKDANGTVTNFARQMDSMSRSVKNTENVLTSFGAKAHRTVMTLGMARFAVMDLKDIFLSFPLAVIKSSGEIERMTRLMQGLSKETDDARKKMEAAQNVKFVFNMAQNAPFEVKALGDAFVKLKTGGLDPTNGSLQALVDGVARFGGTSDQLHRAGIAIQQMAGKGVVSMEELRQQLGEAVPTAMQAMATGMNMTMAELTKAVSKGTVEAKSAIGKMLIVMGLENRGAAVAMMDTWVGMMEKLKTKWELFKLSIGSNGMFDGAKQELANLLKLFDTKTAGDFATRVGAALNDMMVGIIKVTKTIIEMWDYIKLAGQSWLMYWGAGKVAGVMKATRDTLMSLTGSLKTHYDANMTMMRDEQAASTARSAQRQIETARWIQANEVEVAAEQAKAAKLHALQAQRLESEIATNNRILAVQRARVAESIILEEAVAKSSAVKAVQKGVATSAQDLEAQVLLRRAEAAQVGAAQSAAYAAKLEAETIVLQQNLAAHNASAATMTARGVQLQQQNATLAASVAVNNANAVAVTRGTAAMLAMKAASLTVIGAVKSMIFSMNGLIIAIMAAVYAWDYFSSKARKAAEDARIALRAKKDLEEGKATEDKLEAQRRFLAAQKEQRDSNARELQKAESEGGAQNAIKIQRLRTNAAEYTKAIAETEANITASSAQILKKNGAQRANDIAQEAREEADRALKDKYKALTDFEAAQTEAEKKGGKKDKTYFTKREALEKDIHETEVASLKARAKDLRDKEKLAKAGTEDAIAYGDAALALEKEIVNIDKRVAERAAANVMLADPKKKKAKKGPTMTPTDDLLEAMKADEKKRLIARQKMETLTDDLIDMADLQRQADEQIDLIIDQDRHKKIVHSDEDVTRAKKLRAEAMLLEEAVKMQNSVIPRLAASSEKLRELQNQVATGDFTSKPNSEENKTLQLLERLRAKSPEAAAALAPVIEAQRKLIQVSKGIDVNNSIIENEKFLQKERLSTIQDTRLKTLMMAQQEVSDVNAKYKVLLDKAAKFSSEHKRLEEQRAEEIRIINEKVALEMETPLDKMTKDWLKVYEKLDDAGAKWGEGFVDMLTSNLGEGRMEVGKFVEGVLRDILNIQLKKVLAVPLNNAIGAMTDSLKGMIGGPDDKQRVEQEAIAATKLLSLGSKTAGDGLADMAKKGVAEAAAGSALAGAEAVKTAGTTQVMASSFTFATSAADSFAAALNAATIAANSGIGGGGGFGMDFLSGLFGGGSAGGDPTLGTGAFTGGFFADGGIMTPYGKASLRKYAKGGVARGPQVALYGEGSTNEAYVPLPDGNSIPVTMNGVQQTPSVTVNVINQSGQPLAAEQGDMRFDGKQYILDVIATAVNTPGGFRNNMKNALK